MLSKPSEIASELEDGIRDLFGSADLSLHSPRTSNVKCESVLSALAKDEISASGEWTHLVEQKLAKISDTKFAVTTSSGTAALQLALIASGVSAGDEVICPSLTFVATANSVIYVGAQPIFLDISNETLALDIEPLATFFRNKCERKKDGLTNKFTGRPVRAVMVVSIVGLPAEFSEMRTLCDNYGVTLILDGAGALGSSGLTQKSVLSEAHVSTVSFNGNKIITAGGGGAVFTDEVRIAERCRFLSKVAKEPHLFRYSHSELGFNYRMPEINAALLNDQLGQLSTRLDLKRKLHEKYRRSFDGREVSLIQELEGTTSNYWLNTVRIADAEPSASDTVCQILVSKGIQARQLWSPLHRLPHLSNAYRPWDLHETEKQWSACVSLPSSHFLAEEN